MEEDNARLGKAAVFRCMLSERTGHYLERQGLLVRDLDNSYLALEPVDESGLEGVLGSSITYVTWA